MTPRILVVDGVERSLSEWASLVGLDPTTIHNRLERGESAESAVGPRRYRGGLEWPDGSTQSSKVAVYKILRRPEPEPESGFAEEPASEHRGFRAIDARDELDVVMRAAFRRARGIGYSDQRPVRGLIRGIRILIAVELNGAVLEDLGEDLGVTGARVGQLRDRALELLRGTGTASPRSA